MYELSPTEHKKLLKDKITKTHKKVIPCLEDASNLQAKHIAKGIKLDDTIECTAKNPVFIMLKDHKTNLRRSTCCQLLNPCKPEFGKITKLLLEKSEHVFS